MNKDDILARIAEDYLAAHRRGKTPDVDYYVKKCPPLKEDILDLIRSLSGLEQFSVRESRRKQTERSRSVRVEQLPKRLGEFEIESELGRGGMGMVFLAADRVLDRKVALKVMRKGPETTASSIKRFEREAQLASRLHHTNIVPVFGAGSDQGYCYYAMQYVDAVDLRKLIHAAEQSQAAKKQLADGVLEGDVHEGGHAELDTQVDETMRGSADTKRKIKEDSRPTQLDASHAAEVNLGLRSQDAVVKSTSLDRSSYRNIAEYYRSIASIGHQVSDALAYAHSSGVTHRDIKPSNLLIDKQNTVWVTDFGLAKLAEDETMTATGNIVGTLRYMAPEQLAGTNEPASDLYALGLTLYELLTLTPAHQQSTYKALVEQKNQDQLSSLRTLDGTVPRDLETIILKATRYDLEKRYRTAGEMRDDLFRFMNDQPIQARRSTRLESGVRWCRKNRRLASLVATVFILLSALPIILGIAYQREALERQRAQKTIEIALDGFNALYGSFVERDLEDADSELTMESPGGQAVPIGLTPSTGQFLKRMLSFYDRLAEQASTSDLTLDRESAAACRRVASIYQALGQYEEALSTYSDAMQRYVLLGQRDGRDYRQQLASMEIERGRIFDLARKTEDAEFEYESALSRLRQPRPLESDIAKLTQARALLYMGRKQSPGPLELPIPQMRRAPPRDGRNNGRGEGRRPDDRRPPPPRDLGDYWRDFSDAMSFGGSPTEEIGGEEIERVSKIDPERESRLRQALQIIDYLSETSDARDLKFMRAICLRELEPPKLFLDSPDSQRAIAAELLKQLVEQYPMERKYRFELSQTLRDIDVHQLDQKDVRSAIKHLELAASYSEQLVQQEGMIALYRLNLAHIYASLGILYNRDGDLSRSEEFTRKAIEAHYFVAENFPGLKATSSQLVSGPTIALANILLQTRRGREAADLASGLVFELKAVLLDESIPDQRRTRIEQELAICYEIIEHTMR